MRRALRSVLVIVGLFVGVVGFAACAESPTEVVQGDGFSNNH